MDSRFQILWSLSVKLGFRIPVVSGIPDSTSKIFSDSGFHKQNSPDPGIRIPYMAALFARTSLPFVNLTKPEKLKG